MNKEKWSDTSITCTGQWWHGHLPSHGSMGRCELECWSASSHTWRHM